MRKNLILLINLVVLIAFCCFSISSLILAKVKSNNYSNHKEIDCDNCHDMLTSVSDKANLKLNSYCITCHTNQSQSDKSYNFHDNNRSCMDCHDFHKPTQITAVNKTFEFNFASSEQKFLCTTCHAKESKLEMLSLGHFEAADIYHSDYSVLKSLSPSQTCMMCHDSKANPQIVANIVAPQINRHSTHPNEIIVKPGQGNNANLIRYEIDSRIRMFNNRIDCQTCHNLNSEEKSLLSNFNEDLDFCLGCHAQNS